jgi:hypothetical protein
VIAQLLSQAGAKFFKTKSVQEFFGPSDRLETAKMRAFLSDRARLRQQ